MLVMAPTAASRPPSAMLPALTKSCSYATAVYNLIFLKNFLVGYTKNAYNQRGFRKRYLRNSQLTLGILTTKLFTM